MKSPFCSPMVNDKIKGNSGPAPGQKSPSKAPKKSVSKGAVKGGYR